MIRLDSRAPGFPEAFRHLLNAKREISEDVDDIVRTIIAEIISNGDTALVSFSRRFDRLDESFSIGALTITPEEIAAAVTNCSAKAVDALKLAAERIETYHRHQLPKDYLATDELGVTAGWRWTALESVGLYVPGGTASYPSSVLMNAIPARVANVPRIVMAVPTPEGVLNPLVLAAAQIAGVTEIYRMGGAQAVAALAYGTESVRPVVKIVGPGNAYVAAAKRRVFGQVGIDMIAGPSEVLILADANANPDWIAADLLAQAEHDEAAQAILMTDSADLADAVEAAVERAFETLPRQHIARASWRDYGAIITVGSFDEAIPLVDQLAPEHLEIEMHDAEVFSRRIRNAGAIFLGSHTPEAIGDYVGGPNHVLPTARSARFSSGLSVLDFMKRTSILQCDRSALRALGPAAIELGHSEGLDGHARSVAIRLNL